MLLLTTSGDPCFSHRDPDMMFQVDHYRSVVSSSRILMLFLAQECAPMHAHAKVSPDVDESVSCFCSHPNLQVQPVLEAGALRL